MEVVQQFFLFTCITAVLFLLIGMVYPWAMVWWEDIQNRRRVIKIYGSIGVITGVLYFLLLIFNR